MKKTTFILITCLLCVMKVHAELITVDGITYDNYSSTVYEGKYLHVKVVDVSQSLSGDIVIPEIPASYNAGQLFFRVDGIDKRAFENLPNITSVTIPGRPDIASKAFMGCTSLESVTLTNNNSTGKWIYSSAFENCPSLKTIRISNSISKIEEQAFVGCNNLIEFIVDETNTSYSSVDGVLYNKDQTTLIRYPEGKAGQFTIPNGVATIESSALSGCTRITSVSVPASMVSGLENSIEVYLNVFSECTNLTSYAVDEANPAYSSFNGIVYNKNRTTLITCPPAKEGNELVIPDGVNEIGRFAFINCRNLKTIKIPSSTNSIYYNSFRNCNNLTALIVDKANTTYESIEGVVYNKDQTTLISYPSNKEGASFNIPNSVTVIENGAFMSNLNLNKVNMPNGIKRIGDYAFWEASSLESVTIPPNTIKIGEGAFLDAKNIKDIYAPWSDPAVVEVFGYAFTGVELNATLHVPPGTKEVYESSDIWKKFPRIIADYQSSIDGEKITDLVIYPNFVKEGFYVTGISVPTRFELINLSGHKILIKQLENNQYIDIKTLPEGIYIVKLIAGEEKKEQKIIKQ